MTLSRDAVPARRALVVVAAFVGALAVGLIAALALSSSAGSPSASSGASSSPTPSTAPPSPTTSPVMSSQPAAPSPTRSSSATLPGRPAKTSGGLTARTLPRATMLGRGWVFRVDNGSAEGGYVGNGTPTVARSPSEVVLTVTPFGCEQRSSLPTPVNVLETDYRQRPSGTAGVALRLRFVSSAAAAHFFSWHRTDLAACAAQPLEPADDGHHLVSGLHPTGKGTYVSVRTDMTLPEKDRTWTEVSAYSGSRDVLLLAVNKEVTPSEVVRLSGAARSVL